MSSLSSSGLGRLSPHSWIRPIVIAWKIIVTGIFSQAIDRDLLMRGHLSNISHMVPSDEPFKMV